MEVIKILCLGSGASGKDKIIDLFRANDPKEVATQSGPMVITAVVRGVPRHVIIHSYDSSLSVEENYANTDIVLIFAHASLEKNSWQEAVYDDYADPQGRKLSWLEEARILLPTVPFMLVLTGTDQRPPTARKRDGEWVTSKMLKKKALYRGAIADVEVPLNVATVSDIAVFEELFQLAVTKVLEPGVVHIRGCSCKLCCGCSFLPLPWCVQHLYPSWIKCCCPGFPGGFECLRCIPCCRTYEFRSGRDISASQLHRAKMEREDHIALRKAPCALMCPFLCSVPWCCPKDWTDYDIDNEFGGPWSFV
mmetsp:Transcript_35976/g.94363  ORF Transcript_35976/g.94363 Transcript_35976/m.94363 type:complete len:307 (-) Transcript_35976:2162-3082(-)